MSEPRHIVWDGTPATSRYLLVDEATPRDGQPAPIRVRSIRHMSPEERRWMVAEATASSGASLQQVAARYEVSYGGLKTYLSRLRTGGRW